MQPNTVRENRRIRYATANDDELGPLQKLPGVWANIRPEFRDDSDFKGEGTFEGKGKSPFDGRGWNLIALPFAGPHRDYRLLMNQYNEVLRFTTADKNVPNRGILRNGDTQPADQRLAALDYEQTIAQIAAADVTDSGEAGDPSLPIHHEPGLWLHMREQRIDDIDIARLATIPHGNAATALGRSGEMTGAPRPPDVDGFPLGLTDDIAAAIKASSDPEGYLFPYHHFTEEPIKGVLKDTPFPGFSVAKANELLRLGMPNNVLSTTELTVDTTLKEAGIVNIPFITRQADAAEMRSTFWIMELDEPGLDSQNKMVLAYSQFIFLDFFERRDGQEGLIRWPHISINMMEKIEEPPEEPSEDMIIAYSMSDRQAVKK